jgi:nicotinate-nucleotide adenylyltransferase
MDERKRIAIYGGTFDPVHLGHLKVARRVSEFFAISQFLFVPARVAPHKLDREVANGFHRYAMLTLATQHDVHLCVSTFELDGPGRQYTVDTLTYFRARFGESAALFFVMGADSWAEITTWRDWQRLTTLANLVVVTRPGYELARFSEDADSVMVDLRGLSKTEMAPLLEIAGRRIFVTDITTVDVSATMVRQAVRENNGEKLAQLVPLEVANYIRKYGLYSNSNEA